MCSFELSHASVSAKHVKHVKTACPTCNRNFSKKSDMPTLVYLNMLFIYVEIKTKQILHI